MEPCIICRLYAEIPTGKGNFRGCPAHWKPLGSVLRHFMSAKKSIKAIAGLWQSAAMLQTGQCHITLSPHETSVPSDMASRRNSVVN